MSYRKFISLLAVPAVLAFAAPAFSQETECASDADCDEGSACMKEQSASGCDSETPDCETVVYEAETGWCEVLPVECSTNADCGEYLSCESSDSGSCWQSSDGSSGCDPVDVDAPMYCEPAYLECEVDADCPREFECATYDAGCPDIACAEGAECDLPACEPETGGECVPKQIPCDTDAECPSDWSCYGTTQYECSGGGSSSGGATGDPGGPVPVDPADAEPTDGDPPEGGLIAPPEGEETCVEVQVTGACAPEGWGDAYGRGSLSADASGESGEPKGSSGSPDDDEASEESSDGEGDPDSGGGCSVDPNGAQKGGWLWMALVAAPLFFRRRRPVVEQR